MTAMADRREQPTGTETGVDTPSRDKVWEMFDRVAPTYDRLNRMLSLGCDIGWRRRLARRMPSAGTPAVLDLATGTADILLTLARSGKLHLGVGLDMAEVMLRRGHDKITARRLAGRLSLVRGNAGELPFASGAFDAVTIAFGIRNFDDIGKSLQEIARVLRPGGALLILEFSLPSNAVVRPLYLFYLRHILPLVGRLISGDAFAYRYLDRTIETFPYGREFCRLMEKAGFVGTHHEPLTLGVATLYQGNKPTGEKRL